MRCVEQHQDFRTKIPLVTQGNLYYKLHAGIEAGPEFRQGQGDSNPPSRRRIIVKFYNF